MIINYPEFSNFLRNRIPKLILSSAKLDFSQIEGLVLGKKNAGGPEGPLAPPYVRVWWVFAKIENICLDWNESYVKYMICYMPCWLDLTVYQKYAL